jgi:tetratricopeptide (TPR) repeat protein
MVAISALSLIGLSSVPRAWLINAWSIQYTRHAFDPAAKKVLLSDPPIGHDRATLWLAAEAIQAGNPALAEKLVISQVAQGDLFAIYLMIDARLMEGDYTSATALSLQAEDVDELIRVATQAQLTGHEDEALLAFEAALKMDSEKGILPLANFLLSTKMDISRAETLLRQSLVAFPNSRYSLDWYIRLGDELRRQKRWVEASDMYKSALMLNPNVWRAHLGLGWAQYEGGHSFQVALSEFREVIKSPESQGNGQFAIAQLMVRESRFQEADTWYVRAIELNSESWNWSVIRANTARQAGNLTLALSVYRETLKLLPNLASNYSALIYYEMAYAYQLNAQPAEAINAIEQALDLMKPPIVSYYIRAGNIYEWAGYASRALDAYNQALLIEPQNIAALQGVERLGDKP